MDVRAATVLTGIGAAALIVGVGTVVALFLLMQAGMGAGSAARRTPQQTAVRITGLSGFAIGFAGK